MRGMQESPLKQVRVRHSARAGTHCFSRLNIGMHRCAELIRGYLMNRAPEDSLLQKLTLKATRRDALEHRNDPMAGLTYAPAMPSPTSGHTCGPKNASPAKTMTTPHLQPAILDRPKRRSRIHAEGLHRIHTRSPPERARINKQACS